MRGVNAGLALHENSPANLDQDELNEVLDRSFNEAWDDFMVKVVLPIERYKNQTEEEN